MDTIEKTNRIFEILASNEDFEVDFDPENSLFSITEGDTGLLIQARLEGDILFFQLPCVQLSREQLSTELMEKMLSVDNNIWTSNFQIIGNNGTVTIVLTNFAKLQSLDDDDQDDILSCIDFLFEDVVAARQLFV